MKEIFICGIVLVILGLLIVFFSAKDLGYISSYEYIEWDQYHLEDKHWMEWLERADREVNFEQWWISKGLDFSTVKYFDKDGHSQIGMNKK